MLSFDLWSTGFKSRINSHLLSLGSFYTASLYAFKRFILFLALKKNIIIHALRWLFSLVWSEFEIKKEIQNNNISNQNSTNLNYVNGYLSTTYVWPHRKANFSDLKNTRENLRMYSENRDSDFYQKTFPSCKTVSENFVFVVWRNYGLDWTCITT